MIATCIGIDDGTRWERDQAANGFVRKDIGTSQLGTLLGDRIENPHCSRVDSIDLQYRVENNQPVLNARKDGLTLVLLGYDLVDIHLVEAVELGGEFSGSLGNEGGFPFAAEGDEGEDMGACL